MDSSEFGVPQKRRRVFVLASLDGKRDLVSPGRRPVPIGSIINWASGQWSPVKEKVEATRDQVARAQEKHGRECVIVYNGSRNAGRSLDQPAPTVTTVDRLAVVKGDLMRMLTLDEYRACMGFDKSYLLASRKKDSIKLLGNALPPPVAKELVQQIME